MRKLYIATDNDSVMLPVHVETTAKSLASKLGRKSDTVTSCISRNCCCKSKDGESLRVFRVEFEEDEYGEDW